MGNESNPKQLAGTATTTFGSCMLFGLSINKITTGTIIIKEGANTVATIAIGATQTMLHNVANGVRYNSLSIVLSAADDVTAFTKVA